ncbi:MAG: methyltransferase domain-containing protein [Rickettsiaceae bacterium]|nr:methyltransferase domain-containing protein [Rickettsiaceae bacterium]
MIKNDIDKQYDIYYTGSSNSLYNQRFGKNRVIYREYTIITSLLKRVFKQKFKSQYSSIFSFFRSKLQSSKTKENTNSDNIFRILDFGCGDGRIFPVIEKFASKHTKTKFEIIAYDPSIVGLREFINNLKQNGFISIDDNSNDNIIDTKPKDHPKDMSIIDTLVRNNIEVKFLNNKVDAALENITYFTNGQIDAILSIYCPISHIQGKMNKRMVIKAFESLLTREGEVIMTVLTPKSFPNEHITYSLLRRQYRDTITHGHHVLAEKIKATLGVAVDEGDVYYIMSDGTRLVYNLGHVHTKQEFEEDILSSGLKIIKHGVVSIDHPYKTSRSNTKQSFDVLLSLILSSNFPCYPFYKYDELAKNIYIIAKKV